MTISDSGTGIGMVGSGRDCATPRNRLNVSGGKPPDALMTHLGVNKQWGDSRYTTSTPCLSARDTMARSRSLISPQPGWAENPSRTTFHSAKIRGSCSLGWPDKTCRREPSFFNWSSKSLRADLMNFQRGDDSVTKRSSRK